MRILVKYMYDSSFSAETKTPVFILGVREGRTSDMIFSIDHIVSYISQFFTLKTGDIIYTGTPVGVGPVHIDDHLEGWVEDRKVLEFNCK